MGRTTSLSGPSLRGIDAPTTSQGSRRRAPGPGVAVTPWTWLSKWPRAQRTIDSTGAPQPPCRSETVGSWEQRYPGRTTIDICGLTTWSLFELFAGIQWMRRGEEYDRLKDRLMDRLTEELLGQVLRFCPQLEGKIDHVELATPLSFNHFLGRSTGDFMSFAHTPHRFRQRWISAHSPVPGLYFSGQDVVAAGISGAMVGGVTAASAVLGRNVLDDLSAARWRGLSGPARAVPFRAPMQFRCPYGSGSGRYRE